MKHWTLNILGQGSLTHRTIDEEGREEREFWGSKWGGSIARNPRSYEIGRRFQPTPDVPPPDAFTVDHSVQSETHWQSRSLVLVVTVSRGWHGSQCWPLSLVEWQVLLYLVSMYFNELNHSKSKKGGLEGNPGKKSGPTRSRNLATLRSWINTDSTEYHWIIWVSCSPDFNPVRILYWPLHEWRAARSTQIGFVWTNRY